ncbi:putative protein NYNRIN-like, partial [Trifolium medium]|nr:putative protein NYNRIN-like [Trifolium medium]
MCDASDYLVGAVLGQRHEKCFHAIYYASKVMNEYQSPVVFGMCGLCVSIRV